MYAERISGWHTNARFQFAICNLQFAITSSGKKLACRRKVLKIENCKLKIDDGPGADFDARRFRRALMAWYRRHARPLPWRNTTDPYRIWISEIMLQQTTVVAVVPYFERFLERFPTLAILAAAKEEEVLRLWEGLGYYSRARNIHKTARRIVEEHSGVFPDDVEALRELPGIGRYTAGAIASFAFHRAAPILEANTLRLYSRLLGFRGDPRSAAGQKILWDFAARIVPRTRPGPFNQALMELGATLCSPDEPDCPRCPVRTLCAALTNGSQHEIPIRALRVAPTPVTEVAVAIQRGARYLLLKRPAGERWAGLWDFVRFAWTTDRRISPARLAGAVRSQTGLSVAIGDSVAQIRHSVTRFRITLYCYKAEWAAGEMSDANREFRWVTPAQFSRFPLSVTGRKLARLLHARE
jgi:A/G-specific adenine glycosylase